MRKYFFIWLFCAFSLANCIEVENKNFVQESSHVLLLSDQTISYTAQIGTLTIGGEDKNPKAHLSYISYTKNAIDDPSRPIAFCFNGGPGSSSIWLHLGALGPKRIVFEDWLAKTPRYALEQNPHSLLDHMDLVFMDPVSSGFSSCAEGENPKSFYSYEADVKAMSEFIRLYVTRFNRWGSPKILIGESYGAVRAIGMSEELTSRHGMELDGLVLISPVIDYQTISGLGDGNDLPSLLYLPSYTAAAWYHQKLSSSLLMRPLQDVLKEAETFALTDYAQALLLGDGLDEKNKTNIAEKMAFYTGLSCDYILLNRLRVAPHQFRKELFRKNYRSIGRFDSRLTGIEREPYYSNCESDPCEKIISGIFTSTLNQYFFQELNWKNDTKYEVLANVRPWEYSGASNRYLNLSSTLARMISQNRNLKVLIVSGRYDLAIPYFSIQYVVNHLGLDLALKNNIQTQLYDSGHMIYLETTELIKLNEQIKKIFAKRE
ncbi:putative uncharacterized protein [Parachlamydia acanthamoebae UV-7]|uniref:Uncharacterized protein n=1 Tax=Parachlamydia acanthamoebae (strain UV7) TaxID=765952 RepID=F8KYY3_PARAV|nr:hypothetical protein [Parachlamydia acanthamoebae]CCB86104.1 putative uncharacterized protein [Parachlamydia acanthamoebae UV-7]